jgi:16S rRNA (guanine(966)-N(2))-methyltransferase RsmD
MRIISGTHRGKTIQPPKIFKARPTTDMAKESLFNILNMDFDLTEVQVLDLFGGTGGISYEFASRGAQAIDVVELNYHHVSFIKQTAQDLGFSQIKTYKLNAFVFLKTCTKSYDIIFADPPYEMDGIDELPDIIFSKPLLKPDGYFIFESDLFFSLSLVCSKCSSS